MNLHVFDFATNRAAPGTVERAIITDFADGLEHYRDERGYHRLPATLLNVETYHSPDDPNPYMLVIAHEKTLVIFFTDQHSYKLFMREYTPWLSLAEQILLPEQLPAPNNTVIIHVPQPSRFF